MIRPFSTEDGPDVLGAKGHGLAELRRLGLAVPPGFVIDTGTCRAFRRDGRLPAGFAAALASAVGEPAVRRFGGRVSVRSSGPVSMPGMMDTVLDVPAGDTAELAAAVRAVFASWDSPRARTYRELHDIPHESGTAVVVQAMVFGDRDDRSGTGVAFSRDPNTGEPVPYGEVLFRARGEAVVSGTTVTRPLSELDGREPGVWADLVAALARIESHYRDACSVEFTFESGRLWLLQVRRGGFAGRAAVRVAVDLADAGVLDRTEALLRVSPHHLRHAGTPRMVATEVFARGVGACPGVATGRVATTAGAAVRMAAAGPVILVRPHTSPADLHGLAAAAGVVTATGGPASHAAVVARALGKPAVVAAGFSIVGECVRSGDRTLEEGALVTIDGTTGEVATGRCRVVAGTADPNLHRLLAWADEVTSDDTPREAAERLRAARVALAGEG